MKKLTPRKKPLILAVITARGGSKGLPGKNIKILGDKPLIAYSILVASKSKHITHSIVSSDDAEIIKISKQFGAHVPFVRPKKLAGDKTPHLPVMQHAVEFMEKEIGEKFDYIVILQPTSPFRIPEDLDRTIELLIKSGADSAVTVTETEAHEHPIKMKKMVGNKVLPYFVDEPEHGRRQNFPKVYRRSGAAYAMKRDVIMKEGRIYGKEIVGVVVDKDRSIDIDTEYDWVKATYMLTDLTKKGYKW